MIYFSIFIFMFYNSLKYEIIKKKKSIFLFIVGVVFILAFNYQMGTDWINYQRIYDVEIILYNAKDILFNNPFKQEKGYILLNLLEKILG